MEPNKKVVYYSHLRVFPTPANKKAATFLNFLHDPVKILTHSDLSNQIRQFLNQARPGMILDQDVLQIGFYGAYRITQKGQPYFGNVNVIDSNSFPVYTTMLSQGALSCNYIDVVIIPGEKVRKPSIASNKKHKASSDEIVENIEAEAEGAVDLVKNTDFAGEFQPHEFQNVFDALEKKVALMSKLTCFLFFKR
jgi:hypothetical protein